MRGTVTLPRSWRVAAISFMSQRSSGTPARRPLLNLSDLLKPPAGFEPTTCCLDEVSIDFDPFGALWVSGSPAGTDCTQFLKVDKFTPEQLISSGNATSAVKSHPNLREKN